MEDPTFGYLPHFPHPEDLGGPVPAICFWSTLANELLYAGGL